MVGSCVGDARMGPNGVRARRGRRWAEDIAFIANDNRAWSAFFVADIAIIMDRFDAMTAFITVVDLEGFAPAARRLRLSPSVVTRLVAGIEDRLGVRLLNRTTRSISLTDAGARFLERSRRIVTEVAEAEEAAESERGEPAGKLVVTAPLVFGRLHVAPLVCAFMGRFSKVQVDLRLSDATPNLVEEGIDLAIRIGNLPDSAEIARRVGSVRRVLVASPEYLERFGVPQTPAEIAGHRQIAFTALCGPTAWRFDHKGKPIDVPVSPSYVTNSADAAIWHAGNHGGLTFALSYQVVEQVRDGRLAVVLQGYEPQPMPLQFSYSTSRLLSAKVRGLIEMARTTCDWSFLDMPHHQEPNAG
jgi:DNA-binding transcriptional LysR family regulator